MQPHVKIYMDFFGYGEQDFIPSEMSNGRAVDVHHIYGRGKGKDIIENLIGLTRLEHDISHGKVKGWFFTKQDLVFAHKMFIMKMKPDYKFNNDKLKKLRNGKK